MKNRLWSWGATQSKYFTQGCNDLLVVSLITNHSSKSWAIGPCVRSQILAYPDWSRGKYHTLVFQIAHLPGKTADARSRHLVNEYAELASLVLCPPLDHTEYIMNAVIYHDSQHLISLCWEDITSATASDLCANWCISWKWHDIEDTQHHITNDGLNCCIWKFQESLNVV